MVTSMARRTSNGSATANEIAKLKDDVAQLAQQLGNVADTAADGALDQIRAQVQRVKTSIDGVLAQAGDRGNEAADAVRDVSESLTEALEETVHRRPFTTLGVALGLGFIAGAAWRR
jgi:ElaB/YqjD/DUF883 family membrane-anchored ribosome-binding protein